MTHWRSPRRPRFDFNQWLDQEWPPPRKRNWFWLDPSPADRFMLGVVLGTLIGGLVVFGIMV